MYNDSKYMSQELRLKNIDSTRNHFLEKIIESRKSYVQF